MYSIEGKVVPAGRSDLRQERQGKNKHDSACALEGRVPTAGCQTWEQRFKLQAMWSLDWLIESSCICVSWCNGISPKFPFVQILVEIWQGLINNFKFYFYCNLFFDNFIYIHNAFWSSSPLCSLLSHSHPCHFPFRTSSFSLSWFALLACLLLCFVLFCDLLSLTCMDLSPEHEGLTEDNGTLILAFHRNHCKT